MVFTTSCSHFVNAGVLDRCEEPHEQFAGWIGDRDLNTARLGRGGPPGRPCFQPPQGSRPSSAAAATPSQPSCDRSALIVLMFSSTKLGNQLCKPVCPSAQRLAIELTG